jgi:glycosyltransferase involved in cell wall biosynthesis
MYMNELLVNNDRLAPPLLLCAKSEWFPPVRREHAWASIAAKGGHPVTFLARPDDIRRARRRGLLNWLSALGGAVADTAATPAVGVRRRSTLAPGHLNALAGTLDGLLLRRALHSCGSDSTSIVCNWPWDWPAVAAAPARRRVLDMADDWGELMPGRRQRFGRLYEQIAAEADEIIVVNPALAERFPGRMPLVVRNGVDEVMLVSRQAATERHTMIYVGTLSPRFDAELMGAVLRALPDWRLEIVGPCLYPGSSTTLPPAVCDLLSLRERVRWYGPLPREDVIPIIDRSSVAVIPNHPGRTLGQDSMKLYDYAARGVPIVTTRFEGDVAEQPPHLVCAANWVEFAEGVLCAEGQPEGADADRRQWARQQTWSRRWPAWSKAVFACGDLQ